MKAALVLLVVFGTIPSFAQNPTSQNEVCPNKVGVFPANRTDSRDPLSEQARFELRRCNSGDIQVLVFERRSREPVIFLDTHDGWPRQFTNVNNVLALQTVGGSGSAVYIFRFLRGKAMKVIGCNAAENMRVTVNEDGDAVTIDVPANSRTREPAKHHSFAIE